MSSVLRAALQGKADLVTATTLAEAERLLQQRSFALIVLDIKLPDGSGTDLLDHLEALAETPPPVIILAADPPPPEAEKRAAAVMVKTRIAEAKVVETILAVLDEAMARTNRQSMGGASAETH